MMLMRGYDGDARSGLPSALERKEKDNIRNKVGLHRSWSWCEWDREWGLYKEEEEEWGLSNNKTRPFFGFRLGGSERGCEWVCTGAVGIGATGLGAIERGAIGIGAIGIKSWRKGVSEFEKDLMSVFDFKVPHDGRLDFLINS